MPKILISYRRADTADIAGRIFDKLTAHFGTDNVFMDIDNIPLGVDFRDHIAEAFQHGDILLALIGPDWAGKAADGSRKIDQPNDMVRIEVESALKRNMPVIPVLINHATMPTPGDLPGDLEPLAYRNAAEVDSARDFHPHMDRLIRAMDRLLAPAQNPASGTAVNAATSGPKSSAGTSATVSSAAPKAEPQVRRVPPVPTVDRRMAERPPERPPADRATEFAAAATSPVSASGERSAIGFRLAKVALVLVLGLLIVEEIFALTGRIGGSSVTETDAGQSMLLTGYRLYQLPLTWIAVVLLLVFEFIGSRLILDKSLGPGPTWPFATLAALWKASTGSTGGGRLVALLCVLFAIGAILPRLLGLLGFAGDLTAYLTILATLGWTAILGVMVWRIRPVRTTPPQPAAPDRS